MRDCFTIECRSQFLEQLDVKLLDHPVEDPGTGAMLWPGSGCTRPSSTDYGPAGPREPPDGDAGGDRGIETRGQRPRWFHRVKDRLHSQFRESIRACDLAAEAGAHPVHLARVFRAQERRTPGDSVQRWRVRAACDLLGPGHVRGRGGRRLRVLGPEPFRADVPRSSWARRRRASAGRSGAARRLRAEDRVSPRSALTLR